MSRIVKFSIPVAVALCLSLALVARVRAEDKPAADAKGATINVTVEDADGKPAANAAVKVFNQADGAGHKKAEKQAAGDKPKPTPVKEATTGDDGKVKLEGVPAGSYVIRANLKGKGSGMEKVEVAAGDTKDVTIKLKARK